MRPALLAVVATAVLLTACDQGDTVAACDVDVDTAELRQVKADAGIEDCPAGDPDAGTDLPDVVLPCLGGGTEGSLADLAGPAVINFWASNCVPCREEMPALAEFDRQYGHQVSVVGVDFLETYPEAALDLAQRSEVTYPSYADACGGLQETALAVTALPAFVFVRADGSTQLVAKGGVDTVAEIVALAEEHLGIELEREAA
ncbi:TlpA family protein disulfide reductase [Nocardioides stalactiti]|uniref:TlpA family protein disulfide reductase n=1 Tax=Nocardioides stalactiti TaxID=2755356 RepID=UPI0016035784|nr:TlpA disulfide reductase family protein [Nocardioides stalactiti]